MRFYSKVINFDNEAFSVLNVFNNAKMEPEYCTTIFCSEKDCQWMVTINAKSSSELKATRKKLQIIGIYMYWWNQKQILAFYTHVTDFFICNMNNVNFCIDSFHTCSPRRTYFTQSKLKHKSKRKVKFIT